MNDLGFPFLFVISTITGPFSSADPFSMSFSFFSSSMVSVMGSGVNKVLYGSGDIDLKEVSRMRIPCRMCNVEMQYPYRICKSCGWEPEGKYLEKAKKFARRYEIINVSQLDNFFDDGATIGVEQLVGAGLIDSIQSKVKILGDGVLTKKLEVVAHKFSKSAEQKISGCGGTAKIVA